jgi:splicing factor U2AF subunit
MIVCPLHLLIRSVHLSMIFHNPVIPLCQTQNKLIDAYIDLIGNVYARFKYEDSAQTACDALNSRWYAARPIYCELSPVTDFREACCRLNSGEGCVRGGFCNFIHRKEPSPELERELELATKKWLRQRGRDQRSMSRSPSPEPTRKRY